MNCDKCGDKIEYYPYFTVSRMTKGFHIGNLFGLTKRSENCYCDEDCLIKDVLGNIKIRQS